MRPGPATHWLWVRGVWAWGPVTNPTARALASWLCALWGRHEGARGGRLLPGCGASGVGRSPTPDRPSLGRAAGARYPLAVGAGGVGVGTRHLPHSALASWLCALWGRHEGARGGRLLPVSGASGVGRTPPPDRPSLGRAAGARYPLAVGAGGVGVGIRHQPYSARSCELALRAVGAARGRPGGIAPLAWVWGVRGRALSHVDRPSLGRAAGARDPLAVGAGSVGVGTRHLPHSARSCELALRVVGAARGRPGGGGASCLGVGRPRLGALPRPTARPWGVRPGPATHWLWVRGVWAWGPVTYRTARALASWLCALWGRLEGARGGRLLPGCGASGVGRSPTPGRPSLGRAAGARYPLAVGAVGGRGARFSLAPSPVPRFVVCCARFPGLRHPVAVIAWHLSLCCGYGRWRASLACLVAPRRCAAPRPVRSLSVLRSAFPSPWCLPPPRGLSPPAFLGGCAGHVEAGREPGSLCLPLAPAEAGALGSLRVVPWGPAMGLSQAGPSGFGLGLCALRWFGVCGPGH